MSTNPVTAKIVSPYARAIYDYSVKQNIIHQITADFQNLKAFLAKTPELTQYLSNPFISPLQKKETLTKILESQLNSETLKFLLVLTDARRIELLDVIIAGYLDIVYKTAALRIIEVQTAFSFTNSQKRELIKKLKTMTNAREIRLVFVVDSSLIGGFLIKVDSKIIDLTIKDQLQKLAKHLGSVLEI